MVRLRMSGCRWRTASPWARGSPARPRGTAPRRGRARRAGSCPPGPRRSTCSCCCNTDKIFLHTPSNIFVRHSPPQGLELVLVLLTALDAPPVHHILGLACLYIQKWEIYNFSVVKRHQHTGITILGCCCVVQCCSMSWNGRRFLDGRLLRYRKWVPQQLGDVIVVTNSPSRNCISRLGVVLGSVFAVQACS